MPNADLLTETLHFIETHPDEWDQGCCWRCCFGGHALKLSGIPVDGHWGEVAVRDMPEHLRRAAARQMNGAGTVGAAIAARLVLGLDGRAGGLFAGSNEIDDLRRIVGELCGNNVGAGA